MLFPDTVLQGRYRIIRQLGEGGMGAVYEALDQRLSSIVALKETLVEEDLYRSAFEREASLLANLRHPSLPVVTDHFLEGDGQYLVMQFIPGSDLSELLSARNMPFAVADVLGWADDLLDALEYLHGHQPPVIHRDIKPSNLKLTERGHIVLLDFGLAKGAAGQMTTLSTSRSVLGYTPVYASLEQIHGAGTDPRSDLYSLGATLYHLLTNVVPADAPTRFLALEEDRPDPLRPVNEVRGAEVSPALSAVIMRALAVSRKERYASAEEMRRSLRETGALQVAAGRAGAPTMMPTMDEASSKQNRESPVFTIASPTTPAQQAESAPAKPEESYAQPAKDGAGEQHNQSAPSVATSPQSTDVTPTLAAAKQSVAPRAYTDRQPFAQPSMPVVNAQPPPSSRSFKLWLVAVAGLALVLVAGLTLLAVFYSNSGRKSGGPLKPEDRGRILDRTGDPQRAFALNQKDSGGKNTRAYPMDWAIAHLVGGDPALENALFDAGNGIKPGADVRLTIDRNLQQAAADQFKGKQGAVVILNPQTGEVLAMYSNPSYGVKAAQDEETFKRLVANKRDNPTVNRVLNAYYVPGSSFMTFTMLAAFIAGEQNRTFTATSGGYVAEPGARPIMDDGGSCDACGAINLQQAYQRNSNQYFANLAVTLGAERIRNAARLLGIGAYDTQEELLKARDEPEIWDAGTDAIRKAVAPRESTLLTNQKMRKFDLALEGFGQGYAGQMTPLQMALIGAAIGNMEGKLMKPRVEFDRPSEVYNQVVSPQAAAAMRQIMQSVAEGGTATIPMAPVKSAGINVGAKTGTAQKSVPVYDPKTGEPKTRKVQQRDAKGNIIREYDEIIVDDNPRIDGMFLCIAPVERPQIAMFVIVEGGGYGARSAGPIAAALILKAKELGFIKAQ